MRTAPARWRRYLGWALACLPTALVAGLLTLIVVRGEPMEQTAVHASSVGGGGSFVSQRFEHGWPLTFLDRQEYTTAPSRWSFSGEESDFHASALLIDATVAVAILALVVSATYYFWFKARGRIRFSVRWLLVGVLLIASVCGWLSWHARLQRHETRLLDHIACLKVVFWSKGMRWYVDSQTSYRGPLWLARLWERDNLSLFHHCTELFFAGPSRGEEMRKIVSGIKSLRHIEAISFSRTSLTPDSVSLLAQHSRLRSLTLHDTNYWSADLAALKLEHLDTLEITESSNYNSRAMRDVDLTWLATLPRLRKLTLRCPGITDAGIQHLKQLQQLEELDLSGTRITDQALFELAKLRQLNTLFIEDNAGVTADGVARLKSELPNLEVLVYY